MQVHSEHLLRYYWEELRYLRERGEEFARAYPKVAGRLELEADRCPDPHVERLIESFAFLTARIQSNLDSDFPEIAAELLSILYPHYLDPVPSLSVARFDVDPDRGKLTTGYEVPRLTPLFAHSEDGAICRMRTTQPVTLWPIEVVDADLLEAENFSFLDNTDDVAAVLRIRLRALDEPFKDLEVDSLRFYLHGDQILAGNLYELLFQHVRRVALVADAESAEEASGAVRFLNSDCLQPVGFAADEALLPYPEDAQPAYRLLHEYFSFPEKFHFFDLTGLAATRTAEAEQTLDLCFLLDHIPQPRPAFGKATFCLGCSPVVNLFPRTSEPIRVDHRQLEYPLVPDQHRDKTTEVHSVVSVSAVSDPGDESRLYAPFYSFDHGMERRGQDAFWHAKKALRWRDGVPGFEVRLAFLDLDFKPTQPPDETIYAQTLCTNRALAEQLQAGSLLFSDEAIPVSRIVCVKKPTPKVSPPIGGQALWRLISHLSLNYLSLGSEERSLKALREILRLYSFLQSEEVEQQILGIRALSHEKVVRRINSDEWKSFCRGTKVSLTFDEAAYVGSSAFLLASVLNRFFGLYASTNSFTELEIRSLQREGVWKRWPPMAGAKAVL